MSDSATIYQRFTKDVLVVGVAQLILSLRGLILLPLIAKVLGTAAYGVWAQVNVTLSLVGTFASLGIGFSFVRFFAGQTDKEQIRRGFFSILAVEFGWSCLIAIIFFLLAAPLASRLFGGVESINVVRLSALILPFYTSSFSFFFFFRAFREMKLFAALEIALSLTQVGLVVGLVLSGWGIQGAVFSILLSYLLIEIVMFSLIVRRVGLGLFHLADFVKIKDYLRFGLPLLPSDLAGWLVRSSDRYVIALFLGIAATGIYSAAYSLAAAISAYIGPLGMVMVPTLSYLYDHQQIEEVKKHLAYSLKYFLLLAIPSAAGLSLLAKPILQIIATAEFASAGAIIVPFAATAMVLYGSYSVIYQPLILAKKTGVVGVAWGIAAVLNLVLNLLLVPRFGIVAAAATTLLAFAVALVWVYCISSRYLRFKIDGTFIVKSLLASVVMSAVVMLAAARFFDPTRLLDLLVVIAIGAVVYSLVIYLMRAISREEIVFFKGLVADLFHR